MVKGLLLSEGVRMSFLKPCPDSLKWRQVFLERPNPSSSCEFFISYCNRRLTLGWDRTSVTKELWEQPEPERRVSVPSPLCFRRSISILRHQFINAVSKSNLTVGHTLTSCTSEIHFSEPFDMEGREVVLFDTPGFDDTNKTDVDILTEIAVFLGDL
jgi:hypothetical protein